MKKITYSFLVLVQLLFMQYSFAQDSTVFHRTDSTSNQLIHTTKGVELSKFDSSFYKFKPTQLIIPGAFIAYGALSMSVEPLKRLNHSIADDVMKQNRKQISIDNITPFVPAALVYGANWLGLKGKHDFKDRTIILATSAIITTALVQSTKHIVREERPDGSDKYSFPSGHSAAAFATAQFQFMEYKDENIWFALSGYPFAVFTGVARILNNKHYLGDVVAGAGVGILSTQAAYWLFPTVNKAFNSIFSKKKGQQNNVMISPIYQNHSFGLGFVKVF